MSRQTLGILAGVVGSAIGAWWWTSQRASRAVARVPARDRGTVIFDNHTAASDSADNII
ncbi:MAG: hypothetical protein ABIQ52_11240 [Vicinamibacterales bacterium]